MAMLFIIFFILLSSHAASYVIPYDFYGCDKYKFDNSSFPDKGFDYLLPVHYPEFDNDNLFYNKSKHRADCLKYYWSSERTSVLFWATAGCNLESHEWLVPPGKVSSETNTRILTPLERVAEMRRKEIKESNEAERLLYSLKDRYYEEEAEKKRGRGEDHGLYCFINPELQLFNSRQGFPCNKKGITKLWSTDFKWFLEMKT